MASFFVVCEGLFGRWPANSSFCSLRRSLGQWSANSYRSHPITKGRGMIAAPCCSVKKSLLVLTINAQGFASVNRHLIIQATSATALGGMCCNLYWAFSIAQRMSKEDTKWRYKQWNRNSLSEGSGSPAPRERPWSRSTRPRERCWSCWLEVARRTWTTRYGLPERPSRAPHGKIWCPPSGAVS